MNLNRRQLGIGAAAVGLLGADGRPAGAAIPEGAATPPNLPIEKDASLRVLRPAKFVEPDEVVFNANTQAFAAKYGVKIRVDYAGWEDLRPQTAVTANTGAGPDVVLGFTDDPHLYSDKLVDLTDVATYLGQKYGGWYPLAEKYGKKYKTDQWLAIPFGASGGPAVYRMSWLKEVGFDAAPKDTDQLLDCCRKLKAAGHPAGFALGHAVGDANAFCYWLMWSFGGTLTDEAGKVTVNSKETVAALKYVKELYPTFIAGTNSWLDPSNNKAMLAGEIALTQNGVSLYFSAKNSKDPALQAIAADMNHARMPVGPSGKGYESANAINAMVFKHTKAPNAAKAYLQFMMEAPQYDKWMTDSFGYWTQPLRAYEKSAVWTSDPKIAVYKDAMADGRWLAYPGAISEASGAVVADYVVVDMVAAAATGQATPEDAAKEAERRAKRYYRS